MAWLRRIGQCERKDLVHEDVGEGQESSFLALDAPHFLDPGTIVANARVDFEPVVVVLLVLEVVGLGVAQLAEGKAGFADVLGVIVVQRRCADPLVLRRCTLSVS